LVARKTFGGRAKKTPFQTTEKFETVHKEAYLWVSTIKFSAENQTLGQNPSERL
jgi:hypothetical protein